MCNARFLQITCKEYHSVSSHRDLRRPNTTRSSQCVNQFTQSSYDNRTQQSQTHRQQSISAPSDTSPYLFPEMVFYTYLNHISISIQRGNAAMIRQGQLKRLFASRLTHQCLTRGVLRVIARSHSGIIVLSVISYCRCHSIDCALFFVDQCHCTELNIRNRSIGASEVYERFTVADWLF